MHSVTEIDVYLDDLYHPAFFASKLNVPISDLNPDEVNIVRLDEGEIERKKKKINIWLSTLNNHLKDRLYICGDRYVESYKNIFIFKYSLRCL